MYLYLSSDSCTDIFPNNSANCFRVKLPQNLHLRTTDKWSIALLDFDPPKFKDDYKPRFITFESSSCVPSAYKSGLRPILQVCYYSEMKRGLPIRIANPRYVRLNTKHFDSFDMYLRDETDKDVSFKSGALTCTLHLVKEDSQN